MVDIGVEHPFEVSRLSATGEPRRRRRRRGDSVQPPFFRYHRYSQGTRGANHPRTILLLRVSLLTALLKKTSCLQKRGVVSGIRIAGGEFKQSHKASVRRNVKVSVLFLVEFLKHPKIKSSLAPFKSRG